MRAAVISGARYSSLVTLAHDSSDVLEANWKVIMFMTSRGQTALLYPVDFCRFTQIVAIGFLV